MKNNKKNKMGKSKKLNQEAKKAIEIFSQKHKKDPNVIGIVLTGSAVYGKLDKNSDLDVHVIFKDANYRERGSTWINDFEIEYFINPLKQIKSYFKAESKLGAPCTADMLSKGVVIYDCGSTPTLKILLKEAKKIMGNKRPTLKKVEKELMKYHLDDLQKDLEDVYLKKDWFSFNLIANKILEESLNIFFSLKRVYKGKTKRLQSDLKKIDQSFEKRYTNALTQKDSTKKYKMINELVSYLEKLLGGKRTKEWKLKGSLEL